MKKLFTIVALVLLGWNLSAQTGLTTAVDFTANDTHGNSHTLFDYLGEGKYVLIDFFFTT